MSKKDLLVKRLYISSDNSIECRMKMYNQEIYWELCYKDEAKLLDVETVKLLLQLCLAGDLQEISEFLANRL